MTERGLRRKPQVPFLFSPSRNLRNQGRWLRFKALRKSGAGGVSPSARDTPGRCWIGKDPDAGNIGVNKLNT